MQECAHSACRGRQSLLGIQASETAPTGDRQSVDSVSGTYTEKEAVGGNTGWKTKRTDGQVT